MFNKPMPEQSGAGKGGSNSQHVPEEKERNPKWVWICKTFHSYNYPNKADRAMTCFLKSLQENPNDVDFESMQMSSGAGAGFAFGSSVFSNTIILKITKKLFDNNPMATETA